MDVVDFNLNIIYFLHSVFNMYLVFSKPKLIKILPCPDLRLLKIIRDPYPEGPAGPEDEKHR